MVLVGKIIAENEEAALEGGLFFVLLPFVVILRVA
jgi:hypothetical protein